MDPEIKKEKYVSNRILSGLYKANVELQIVKVRVHLIPGPTWFLSRIQIQKLKRKNMFLTGSYPVSRKAVFALQIFKSFKSATLPYLFSN